MPSYVARVTTTGVIGGFVQQNVLHFEYIGSVFDHGTIKSEIETQWIPIIKVLQASDFEYRLITVRNVSTIGDPPISYVVSIHGGGGTVLNWWGPMSVVFSLRTSHLGRSGRGRFYLGGFYVGQVGQGQFTSSAQIQNANVAANLMARYTVSSASPISLGVTSRANPDTDFKPVINIIPAATPGVQRRRNYGVGI